MRSTGSFHIAAPRAEACVDRLQRRALLDALSDPQHLRTRRAGDADRHTSLPERICLEAGCRRPAQLRGRLAQGDHHRSALRLTNALQLVTTTPRALTQYEAGFHSSAEKYRERASLIRDSMSASIGAEERAQLVAVATDFE